MKNRVYKVNIDNYTTPDGLYFDWTAFGDAVDNGLIEPLSETPAIQRRTVGHDTHYSAERFGKMIRKLLKGANNNGGILR